MSPWPHAWNSALFCAAAAALALAPGPAAADGMPDLIVRADRLASQWVVRDEKLSADTCSVIEGEVTAGVRRLLRFTVMTPNVGDADISIGDPNEHVAADDGLFEFATCHHHYHFRHYALYQLIDPATGQVWKAAKKETGEKKPAAMGKNSGCEFVDSIFGRDRELEKTEKLMTGMRLWSMRFDANCEDILRSPSA